MTDRTRPPGLTILAVMGTVAGLVALLAGVAYAIVSRAAGATTPLGGLEPVLAVLLFVTGVVDLIFAFGAWTLRPWGWTVGLVAAGLMIVSALIRVVDNPTSAVISIAISVVIIYYLNTAAVKAAFGRA
jgi:uncharacterized membrane protein (DUF2068 family)